MIATNRTTLYEPTSDLPACVEKPELRVLQVFSVLGMGGAETWLMALLKYFRDHPEKLTVTMKVDVLLTGGSPAVFDDEALTLGARLFYLPFARRNVLPFMRGFRRILSEGHYDAIHDHQDYIAGLHFLMGAGHLPPKRVVHVHNPLLHNSNYRTGLARRITSSTGKQLLRHFATDIAGTSLQVLGEYGFDRSAYPLANLKALHCGFDVLKFRGDAEQARFEISHEIGLGGNAKILLFVGRLDSHKDPDRNQKNPLFALEVARVCIQQDPNFNLLIAGSGDGVRAELVRKVRSWGLENNVHFLGLRLDVPRLMLASDLLLFPSLAEGLGMVVVEAQAAGLRVIASDTTPAECVVLPQLVRFQSLAESASNWATQVMRIIQLPPPDRADCNSAVKRSKFSIESSVESLLESYAGANKEQ